MTKIAMFAAAVAATCSMAGAAMAHDLISSSLQTPITGTADVTAGGVVWSCSGATCTVKSDDLGDFDALDACKTIARQYGVVASFTGLDTAGLAKCNRVAHH